MVDPRSSGASGARWAKPAWQAAGLKHVYSALDAGGLGHRRDVAARKDKAPGPVGAGALQWGV